MTAALPSKDTREATARSDMSWCSHISVQMLCSCSYVCRVLGIDSIQPSVGRTYELHFSSSRGTAPPCKTQMISCKNSDVGRTIFFRVVTSHLTRIKQICLEGFWKQLISFSLETLCNHFKEVNSLYVTSCLFSVVKLMDQQIMNTFSHSKTKWKNKKFISHNT